MSTDPALVGNWIKQAAELAAEAPESLREAAFRAAYDTLAASGVVPSTRRAPRRGRIRPPTAPASPGRPAARRTAQGRIGPKAAVAALVDEGYFDQPQTVNSVREHLASTKGRRLEAKHVATAVLRLLRDGALDRNRGGSGDYEYTRSGHS